ncbi:hypothetical protein A6R68_03388, partial [Neotoma lepida]
MQRLIRLGPWLYQKILLSLDWAGLTAAESWEAFCHLVQAAAITAVSLSVSAKEEEEQEQEEEEEEDERKEEEEEYSENTCVGRMYNPEAGYGGRERKAKASPPAKSRSHKSFSVGTYGPLCLTRNMTVEFDSVTPRKGYRSEMASLLIP